MSLPDRDIVLVPVPERHPLQLFVFALCVISGAPVLLGKAPAPEGIRANLPTWVAFAWSGSLVIGALLVFVGTFWKDRLTGCSIEQVGLVATGAAGCVYGGILIYRSITRDPASIIPSCVILGFGLSCLVRFFQLQKYIDDAASAAQSKRD